MRHRWLGLTLLMHCLAGGVGAQGTEPLRQPGAIPTELAVALASGGGFSRESDPQILVGAVPGWIESRLFVPPGARVVGSAFLGTTIVGVVNVPNPSENLLREFEDGLKARGWTAVPASPSVGQSGGFRPAPSSQITGISGSTVTSRPTALTLCGADRQTITAWVGRRRASDATVTMRVTSAAPTAFSQCNPMPRPRNMPEQRALPTLYNPAGATDAQGFDCFDRGEGYPSSGTSTRLRGSFPATGLLDHYARQLRDSGWAPTTNEVAEVKREFVRTDSGRVVHLNLTVRSARADTACTEVNLMVEQARRP